jgi:hypothetical protein
MRAALVLFFFIALAPAARAQDAPAPAPTPSRKIRLTFVPPPLEGTISLGIFDANGKLVRTLQREADIADFTVGHDALSTTWDGLDDARTPMPPGKYRARGYLVGDLKIEGVGYFFNDWVTGEKSPRIARITALSFHDNQLRLAADLSSGKNATVLYDAGTGSLSLDSAAPPAKDNAKLPPAQALTDPVASAAGKDGSFWIIDRIEKGADALELKQLSAAGEFSRRLPFAAADPKPKAVAASTVSDAIYLLEEDQAVQRVRGLTLVTTKPGLGDATPAVSEWKVSFEKRIVAHANFSVVKGKPEAASPNENSATEKILVKLQPNPLSAEKRPTIEIAVGFDEHGSFLKTADGLPLRAVSETPFLKRIVPASHDDKTIDVFQDDGAVVEQFRLSALDQIMAFDCGDFELP